jgi:signal transduction histidine kinase
MAWRPPAETVVPREDRLRVEQLLAGARLFLAAVALITVRLEPSEPEMFAATVLALLVLYAVFAAALWALVHWAPSHILSWRAVVHAVDIGAATLITVLTQGPSSPFFVFFIFVLLAAGLRWGSTPTALTGAAIIVWYLGEGLLHARYAIASFEGTRFLMRAAYLLVATLVLAQLAGMLGTVHTESELLSTLLARVKRGDRFTATLQTVIDDCLRYTRTSHALLALKEDHTGSTYVWRVRSSSSAAAVPMLTTLTAAEASAIFAVMPDGIAAWHAASRGTSVRMRALGEDGALTWINQPAAPQRALLEAERSDTYTAVRVPVAEWDACLFLFGGPAVSDSALRFMRRMATQIGPAMHSQYLLARVRARIGDLERARLARELHDGLIQSLIGLEMQLDAVRRQASAPDMVDELQTIQARLHGAILDTRDLMAHLRPKSQAREGLINELSVLIERFRHDTGIEASLTSNVDDVDVPPRVAQELARIVQEALVNVRKHAEARHVVVRLARADDQWRLSIDDDGRGFAFSGVLSQEDLDRQRRGPVVIKERVRAIGGELSIESEPGRGSRLAIVWPLARRSSPGTRAS